MASRSGDPCQCLSWEDAFTNFDADCDDWEKMFSDFTDDKEKTEGICRGFYSQIAEPICMKMMHVDDSYQGCMVSSECTATVDTLDIPMLPRESTQLKFKNCEMGNGMEKKLSDFTPKEIDAFARKYNLDVQRAVRQAYSFTNVSNISTMSVSNVTGFIHNLTNTTGNFMTPHDEDVLRHIQNMGASQIIKDGSPPFALVTNTSVWKVDLNVTLVGQKLMWHPERFDNNPNGFSVMECVRGC